MPICTFLRRCAAFAIVGLGALVSDASAGTLRVWPSTVVVDDAVYLSDLCEISGFDHDTEQMLRELVVSDAPAPGTSHVIPLAQIRRLLGGADINMASLTLRGSARCTVDRPSILLPTDTAASPLREAKNQRGSMRKRASRTHQHQEPAEATLRDAVTEFFNQVFSRYGGRADIRFDRTAATMLDLSGPTYAFDVQRRGTRFMGLVQLEVNVLTQGRVVQTVPLVVQVAMMRREVVARRAINQGATIGASDVELVPLSFTRLDKLGLTDVAQAIGQRSKRFVAIGRPIDPEGLEQVPLVTRGQHVTVTAISGAIRVVTAGTATQDGLLGETIKIRASDKKRVELEAWVVGPGAVQVGGRPRLRAATPSFAENRTR